MEYRFSDKALAFEAEVNEFLDQEWTADLRATIGDPTTDTMDEERGFRRLLADRGWLTMSWPAEYGGQERSLEEQYLFWEAMNYAGAPQATVATQQVGPTLMRFGTDEQQERFLPPIARGEVEFALGYTEPDAGSDLASLQLRAVKDGDDYILNGIKRFTSGAHRSEYVWLATRTDPDAPKHRGVSMMLVDMQSAGITVKPLWTMAGYRTNEVYFEDVRVPTNVLVGEENRGWYYAPPSTGERPASRSSRSHQSARSTTGSWTGPPPRRPWVDRSTTPASREPSPSSRSSSRSSST